MSDAREQDHDRSHLGPSGGPHTGAAAGEPESAEHRRTAADERTDPAAPPAVEEPG